MIYSDLSAAGRLLDSPSGSLAKLTIEHEVSRAGKFERRFPVLFNPSELNQSRQVGWQSTASTIKSSAGDCQKLEFIASTPPTLSLDLFFDTLEGAPAGSGGLLSGLSRLMPDLPFAASVPTGVDVRLYTGQVTELARIQPELHRPPLCRLSWGQSRLMEGYLTQLSEQFNYFMADGTPVRAKLSVVFQALQSRERALWQGELHSSDVEKRHTVVQGDTLPGLARNEYGDPRQWRLIASANGLTNPHRLVPGQILIIPIRKS